MYFSGITSTPNRLDICIHSLAPGFLRGTFRSCRELESAVAAAATVILGVRTMDTAANTGAVGRHDATFEEAGADKAVLVDGVAPAAALVVNGILAVDGAGAGFRPASVVTVEGGGGGFAS